MTIRDLMLKAAQPLARFVLDAGNQRLSSRSRLFWPGSKLDWSEKAGLVYDNSVVAIGINFMCRNMASVPMVVERMRPDGTWVIDPKHPFPADWAEPNPWYSGSVLSAGMTISDVAAGNSYVVPLRRNNGRPGFAYLPHTNVDIETGDGFVSKYIYRVPGSGAQVTLWPDEIIHFRNGIDPQDMRKGMSPLAALVRDIATDNLGTTYSAALLNRMGVPGMAFVADAPSDVSPEQQRQMKEAFESVFSGDGAGRLAWIPVKGKLEVPGGGPERLALDALRTVPAARILAAMGLSDQALGMPSQSKTYDNYGESIDAAWEQGLLPLMMVRAERLSAFVRSWYGDDERTRVAYDLTRVRALQPDLDKTFTRWNEVWKSGMVKRKVALAAIGEQFDETEDDVYSTEAVLGVGGTGKGLIKAAGALAASRRRALEDLGSDPDDPG